MRRVQRRLWGKKEIPVQNVMAVKLVASDIAT
jgi:hypothetical protein